MSMCINPSIPCMSPIAKNTPYFFILPLIFTIAKNYSLVLNFTPYFHKQGVNYSFGKTLARALSTVYQWCQTARNQDNKMSSQIQGKTFLNHDVESRVDTA